MREIVFRLWLPSIKKMSHAISITDWANGYQQITISKDCVWLQSSGLKDKNGRVIFEGDFVRYPNAECKGDIKVGQYSGGEYDTYEEGNGFFLDRKDKVEGLVQSRASILTIIGNIYENPELIKQ